MAASPIRLLSTAAVLAIGLAVGPVVSATAAPVPSAHESVVQTSAEPGVAVRTGAETVLGAAQRVPDGGSMRLVDDRTPPPAWLLVLLVPILLGGVITTGYSLRRLR